MQRQICSNSLRFVSRQWNTSRFIQTTPWCIHQQHHHHQQHSSRFYSTHKHQVSIRVQEPPLKLANEIVNQIKSHLENFKVKEAEKLFHENLLSMQHDALVASCNLLLHVYIRNKFVEKVSSLFHIMSAQNYLDAHSFDLVIAMYAIKRDLRRIEGLYKQMCELNLRPLPNTIHSVMETYIKYGEYQKAADFFKLQEESNVSSWVYLSYAKALTALSAPNEVRHIIWNVIPTRSMPVTEFIMRLVRDLSSKMNLKGFARVFVHEAIDKVTIDIYFLLAYIETSRPSEAEAFVRDVMKKKDVKVTMHVISSLMSSYVNHKQRSAAKNVLAHIEDFKLKPCAAFYNILLDSFSASDDPMQVDALLKEMERDSIEFDRYTFNILTRIYGNMRRFNDALNVVTKMKSMNCKPDQFTLANLISMYGQMPVESAASESIQQLLREFSAMGIKPNQITNCVLLKAYAKLNKLDEASDLLSQMEQDGTADGTAYCTLLLSYVINKKHKQAEQLFSKLQGSRRDGIVACTLMIRLYTNVRANPQFDKIKQIVEYVVKRNFAPSQKFIYTVLFAYDKVKENPAEIIQFIENNVSRKHRKSIRKSVEEYMASKNSDRTHLVHSEGEFGNNKG